MVESLAFTGASRSGPICTRRPNTHFVYLKYLLNFPNLPAVRHNPACLPPPPPLTPHRKKEHFNTLTRLSPFKNKIACSSPSRFEILAPPPLPFLRAEETIQQQLKIFLAVNTHNYVVISMLLKHVTYNCRPFL